MHLRNVRGAAMGVRPELKAAGAECHRHAEMGHPLGIGKSGSHAHKGREHQLLRWVGEENPNSAGEAGTQLESAGQPPSIGGPLHRGRRANGEDAFYPRVCLMDHGWDNCDIVPGNCSWRHSSAGRSFSSSIAAEDFSPIAPLRKWL